MTEVIVEQPLVTAGLLKSTLMKKGLASTFIENLAHTNKKYSIKLLLSQKEVHFNPTTKSATTL